MNYKKNNVVGILFRKRREALGYRKEDVAKLIQVSVRSIRRIENGDALSSFNSYIISQLLKLYQFTDEEIEKVRWYICIFKDVIGLLKKYNGGGKCHG